MADLDRLLRPDISHAAADAVEPPDFAPIERRGVQRRRTHAMLITAAAVLVGLIGVVGGLGILGTDEAAPPTPVDRPPPALMPAGDAAIEPGTYQIPRAAWSAVDFTVTFPEGWSVQYGRIYHKHQDEDDELGLQPVVIDGISSNPCRSGSAPKKVGPRPKDLVAALLEQRGPVARRPVDTALGGYPASRIDLRAPKRSQGCPLLDEGSGLQLWYSEPYDDHFVLLPDGRVSVYVLDVDGGRQVFVTQYRSSTSEEDRAELQEVLDSIRIER